VSVAPCPVCAAPHGFHDDGPHARVVVPAALVRPGRSVSRAEDKARRHEANQAYLRSVDPERAA
jgi:hypothetical protein